jgi:hypothetical protein
MKNMVESFCPKAVPPRRLSADFSAIYSDDGRLSIPPEKLLRPLFVVST